MIRFRFLRVAIMRMRKTVKVRNRNCVRLAFIVCLAAVWGSVFRTSSHGEPLPQTASQLPAPADSQLRTQGSYPVFPECPHRHRLWIAKLSFSPDAT